MLKSIFTRNMGMRSLYQLIAVLVVGAALIINIIATLLAARFPLSVDLTKNSAFEISEQSKQMLAETNVPITINVLAKEDVFARVSAYNAQAIEIIKLYPKYNKQLNLRFVDFVADPSYTSKYATLSLKQGDLIVESGERYKLVRTEELFTYQSGDQGTPVIAGCRAEQAISAAILSVWETEKTIVSILGGGGEPQMQSFEELLSANNYEIKHQNLVTEDIDPAAKIAIMLAPRTDASEEMLNKLDAFLNNGGAFGKTLLYCADADQPELKNINVFLGEWGVKVNEGAVFETDENRVYNYHPYYTIADYAEGEFADMMLNRQMPMLIPLSKPLEALYQFRDFNTTEVLLVFAKSTGVRPPDAPESFTAANATERGPFPAVILAKRAQKDPETGRDSAASHIVVSGSIGMLDEFALTNPALTNAEYMLNLLGTLSNRQNTIRVSSKALTGSPLGLTRQKADFLGTLFIAVLPALILAAGVVVWVKRRRS